MKLILSNNEAIEVKRINQSIVDTKMQLDITIEGITDINELKNVFEGNSNTISLQKDDGESITFTDYDKISMVSRDISEFDDVVRITLTK